MKKKDDNYLLILKKETCALIDYVNKTSSEISKLEEKFRDNNIENQKEKDSTLRLRNKLFNELNKDDYYVKIKDNLKEIADLEMKINNLTVDISSPAMMEVLYSWKKNTK
jgi:small-conductance mechanosensitive channel